MTDADCPLKKLVNVNEPNIKYPHKWDENPKYQCAFKIVQVLKSWICRKYFEDE